MNRVYDMNNVAAMPMPNIQYPFFFTRDYIRSLRGEVSPPFYRSLEGIWKMMQTEVFNPLSFAKNEKDFLERIEKVLPQFSYLRIAMIGLLLSYYSQHLQQLQDELTKASSQLEKDIEKRGRRYMGVKEQLCLKSILHTASGVSRRALHWIISQTVPEKIEPQEEYRKALTLFGATTRFELLLIFIFSVLEGETKLAKSSLMKKALDEARICAHRYFFQAKRVGLLAPLKQVKIISPKALTKEEIEEDRELTEAGLEDYISLLKVEDEK